MNGNHGFTTADLDVSPDVRAITELERTLSETTDVETLLAFYATDAVRIGPYAPGIYHGAAEIRTGLQQQLSRLTSSKLDEIDLNVVTNGEMAAAYSQQKISTTDLDGNSHQTSLRSHDVFQKSGQGWQIVLQHTSHLGDMARMAAVMDGPIIKPGPLHWDCDPFPEPPIDIAQAERELYEWQIDDVHAQVAEQAMHYYGPGDYATVFDSRIPGGRMVGMWDIYQGWLPQMQLKRVDDTLAEFRVFTDGQFAAVYTIQDIVATKLDGSVLKEQIRQTDCLHRVEGHWYSYVESVSWPFDQATGKLILNLPVQARS